MTSRLRFCVIATSLALLIQSPLAAAPKKGGPKLVPFKGRWVGESLGSTATEDPNIVEESAEGGGNATHLGKYSMSATSSSTLDTLLAGGEHVFTAANGDQVFATFTGEFLVGEDGLIDGELDATITGGTGRFENSTGYYTFRVTTDPVTLKSVATFTGKISGPGKGN